MDVQNLRTRLALRYRFRNAVDVKHDAELQWWIEHWDPIFHAGGLYPPDAAAILGEEVASTYLDRRWQQARAEVVRVLREAGIEDADFFSGKVLVDIGPGPLGFPDACPAHVSIGIDPLAQRFAQAGLLLPGSDAIYLSTSAERIPLITATVDVVVARNSLDHVDDPQATLGQAQRILRPNGTLILMFDVGHRPTPAEPHSLELDRVRSWLPNVRIDRERASATSFGPGSGSATLVGTRLP